MSAPRSAAALDLRNRLWARATTEGMVDPDTGRVRPFAVAELARLWGVTPRAVRNGLRSAEALGRALEVLGGGPGGSKTGPGHHRNW